MKLIHLSDLHLGKRVNGFSMLEDQEYILNQILDIIDAEKPRAVLLAGDIYDKSVPPAEAVRLFDRFLCELSARELETFVISGNHDSAERVAFGGRLMERSGVHLAPVYSGNVEPSVLEDEYGSVYLYMLPFVKPANVRAVFENRDIDSYTSAVSIAVEEMKVDSSKRNILMTHQFVTGAERSDSEDISVGGTDNVDAAVFDVFDYVALGHIHGPQSAGRETVRYCGTPLKYSFSEKDHVKSVTVVEMGRKGSVELRTIPLTPLRDMREIKGTYNELTLMENYKNTPTEDYIRAILTDEDDIPDVAARLRNIYPNLMKVDYDNLRTRTETEIDGTEDIEKKSEMELFEEFYEQQNGQPMSPEQREFSLRILEKLKEETI